MTRPDAHDVDITEIYDTLTNARQRWLRVDELIDAASARYPGVVPSRTALEQERLRAPENKLGLEVDVGRFVSRVLAQRDCGRHLIAAMSRPRTEATAFVDQFRHEGSVDLGPIRVDRIGRAGHVTLQQHDVLNAEDDASTAAFEIAVDLVLLDDETDIGVVRGGISTHPRHAGQRVFGSGINLTELSAGRITLVGFMLDRELGAISKILRGQSIGLDHEVPEQEKPWIAAVDGFAIGGACQRLLVMDKVIAAHDAYFSLPAHQDGIIPGCANLRLPRLIGQHPARRAIIDGQAVPANSRTGRLLADVVPAHQMDAELEVAITNLTQGSPRSLLANRRALRIATETLDAFRHYMSLYAREQSECMADPSTLANLGRRWRKDTTTAHHITT